jgi:hypothetical protein
MQKFKPLLDHHVPWLCYRCPKNAKLIYFSCNKCASTFYDAFFEKLNLQKYILKPELKKFILNEIKKNYNSKKINMLLNCILNNLSINIKKINMVEIENNNIKKHYYLNF